MEGSIILTLSLCLLLSLIMTCIFYFRNRLLKQKIIKIKEKNSEMEKFNDDLMLIEPGDKAILPDYQLKATTKTTNESFSVTYELEIVEISENKVKVIALDFTSSDKAGKDPANKAGIIEFMKNKWVDKSSIQLVMDNSIKRDIKLRKLGIN